jgi:hypothetical protein
MTALVAGLILSMATLTMVSQPADTQTPTTPPCGLGQGMMGCGGRGCNLTPEQRAERKTTMQAYVAGLREKKANSTITPQEQAWLEQAEERGGLCINGVPRGPRGGFGAQGMSGQRQGRGQGRGGMGRGWGGGAGAGANPNCPLNQQ